MYTTIDDASVISIYDWFKDSISCARILPQCDNTDIRKTYTFRVLQKFAIKACLEWKLDDNTIKSFILIAIKYAKANGIAHKGASILIMPRVIEYTLNHLSHKCEFYKVELDNIVECHKWLSSLGNKIRALVRPYRYGGHPSIIYYYETGKIPASYLAISRLCRATMNSLDKDDRNRLPPLLDLKIIRIRLLNNQDINQKLQQVMGSDLIGSPGGNYV